MLQILSQSKKSLPSFKLTYQDGHGHRADDDEVVRQRQAGQVSVEGASHLGTVSEQEFRASLNQY